MAARGDRRHQEGSRTARVSRSRWRQRPAGDQTQKNRDGHGGVGQHDDERGAGDAMRRMPARRAGTEDSGRTNVRKRTEHVCQRDGAQAAARLIVRVGFELDEAPTGVQKTIEL